MSSGDRVGTRAAAPDRTRIAVERQLGAMDCRLYEVGIRESATEKMMNRLWSACEVLERLPWLRRLNAHGNDIYGRPAAGSNGPGLVLVDDLRRGSLDAMERAGVEAAVVVETSPNNFQAWISVGPAAPDVRGRIARRLAQEWGGDPGSARDQQYGRLAGFTNRKAQHTTPAGLQPYVLLHGASGRKASRAPELIEEAEATLAALRRGTEASRPALDLEEDGGGVVVAFRAELEALRALIPDDRSRRDYLAAQRLACAGYGAEEIVCALLQSSPKAAERSPGAGEKYARDTVSAALGSRRVRAFLNRGIQADLLGKLEASCL